MTGDIKRSPDGKYFDRLGDALADFTECDFCGEAKRVTDTKNGKTKCLDCYRKIMHGMMDEGNDFAWKVRDCYDGGSIRYLKELESYHVLTNRYEVTALIW